MNFKTLNIDAGNCHAFVVTGSYVESVNSIYRGTEYIFRCTVYTDYNPLSTEIFTNFISATNFRFYIGNTTSLLSSTTFNNISDWSLVNLSSGLICFKFDTTADSLFYDLCGQISKQYVSEIWYTNHYSKDTILLQQPITIRNVIGEL